MCLDPYLRYQFGDRASKVFLLRHIIGCQLPPDCHPCIWLQTKGSDPCQNRWARSGWREHLVGNVNARGGREERCCNNLADPPGLRGSKPLGGPRSLP